MSLPLKDVRTAVPESTDVWIEIESQAAGVDRAAVARDVLNRWAKEKAHAFKIAHRILRANGAQTDWLGDDAAEGAVGTADAGTSRRERR